METLCRCAAAPIYWCCCQSSLNPLDFFHLKAPFQVDVTTGSTNCSGTMEVDMLRYAAVLERTFILSDTHQSVPHTGTAVSNVFDGVRDLDATILQGIKKPCKLGMLTLFEWWESLLQVTSKSNFMGIWAFHLFGKGCGHFLLCLQFINVGSNNSQKHFAQVLIHVRNLWSPNWIIWKLLAHSTCFASHQTYSHIWLPFQNHILETSIYARKRSCIWPPSQ